MSQATVADTRNLEWKNSNVGAKLLQKMGWKEGQAVGRRQDNTTNTSSEGLRLLKRNEGLGIGASSTTVNNNHHPVEHFSSLLVQLNNEHTSSRRRNKKKRQTVLPTNKTTHHKVRQAKFQSKSQEDLKSIFGGVEFPVVVDGSSEKTSKKRKSE